MAFAGPSFQKNESPEGYCTLAPADYIPYFQSKNVGLVVRLNQKNYNEQDFINVGIDHLDQFYLDGSCPPMKILQRVLSAFEAVPKDKAFAVHCKAGLGRTGTCIGAYMMKHYRMTAPEVIGWMRICRPGCVIGPQQQFLQDLEPIMWQEGDMMRLEKGISLPPISSNAVENNDNDNSNNKKKRTSVSSKSITTAYPETTSSPNTESATGRPGQAEALLASRRQWQAAGHSCIKGNNNKSAGPAPITPDSATNENAKSFATKGSGDGNT